MTGAPVVVLYHRTGEDEYPLRSTIEDHLYAWKRYSSYNAIYVNAAYRVPMSLLEKVAPAAVLLHTSLLSTRWSRQRFGEVTPPLLRMRDWPCHKIAMPQDEFINTDILDDFLADVGVTHVLTCADTTDWGNIYPRTARTDAVFRRILTGYLDEKTIRRVSAMRAPDPRPIDIGYRAWKAAPWLGGWARHKVELAQEVARVAQERGLRTDISLETSDTFLGDEWFAFLLRCRSTFGVEGGASVLDRDGSIKGCVDDYLARSPNATFAEVESACFAGQDGLLSLMALSPRHLEACLTRTPQLLVEGEFNGVLHAGRHYFPLKSDYSNLPEALDFLADDDAVREMTERAYDDVVASGRVTYRQFVAEVDAEVRVGVGKAGQVLSPVGGRGGSRLSVGPVVAARLLGVWDQACWARIALEARWLRKPGSRAGRLVRRVRRLVRVRYAAAPPDAAPAVQGLEAGERG